MSELTERCRAYDTVAQAIRFIRTNARQQPTLDDIAAHVGLTPIQLQRLFSTWAGISPKRFLQHLTRDHARSLLRANHDVLAATYDAGLSGPGRLHDLMISCDGVTPGEVRQLGDGLEIAYGFGATPFGRIIVGTTARGLCHLCFLADDDAALSGAVAELRVDWPLARLQRDDRVADATIAQVFSLHAARRPLHLLLHGTNFQIKVWEALLQVAPGQAVSYQTLAGMTGNPRAQRAVGSALAQNRIALLIPCHRVIREDGTLGQYRWGRERKAALLAFESAATSR